MNKIGFLFVPKGVLYPIIVFLLFFSVSVFAAPLPNTKELQSLIRDIFVAENVRLLDKASMPVITPTAKVVTHLTKVKVIVKKDTYIVNVVEVTSYGYDDGTPPYEYRALHRITFTQPQGDWVISNIESLDPTSDVRDDRVLRVMNKASTSAKTAEEKLSDIVRTKAAIERNLPILRTMDRIKESGQTVIPSYDEVLKQSLVIKQGIIPKSNIARPEIKPLVGTSGNLVTQTTNGGGPPYSYSAMVS